MADRDADDPLFGGVSISATELALEEEEDPLLHTDRRDQDEEEDIFSHRAATKKFNEDDLFGGLDDPIAPVKKQQARGMKVESLGIFDDEAEEMLSHDYNDLLVLKRTNHKEEGIFKDVPRKVDLAVPEEDVRIPDVDLNSIQSLQQKKVVDSAPNTRSKTSSKSSGSGLFKRGDSKISTPTTIDDELFGLVGGSTTNTNTTTASTAAALDDISSYIAKQQQTTSKGLFDD